MAVPMLTGVFENRNAAECAFVAALERGYKPADINVLMSDATRDRSFRDDVPNTELADKVADGTDKAKSSAVLGGPASGTAGTIAPIVAAVGVLALLPGLGLVIAGPVAAAVAAAGAVGLAGGLIGALADWGIPTQRIEQYEATIRAGGILLGVKPSSEEDADALRLAWEGCSGRKLRT
jgi:hypothetical protein